jgi:hypothetical protein
MEIGLKEQIFGARNGSEEGIGQYRKVEGQDEKQDFFIK